LPCDREGCWLFQDSDTNGGNGRVGEACCGGCAHGGNSSSVHWAGSTHPSGPSWCEPCDACCASAAMHVLLVEGSNVFPISVEPFGWNFATAEGMPLWIDGLWLNRPRPRPCEWFCALLRVPGKTLLQFVGAPPIAERGDARIQHLSSDTLTSTSSERLPCVVATTSCREGHTKKGTRASGPGRAAAAWPPPGILYIYNVYICIYLYIF
jgi:hypothetical protein